MKRGKAKLLTETDIKNCLRYIDDMENGERNRAMFEMMLNTALRIHSIQKLTIGQVYDDDQAFEYMMKGLQEAFPEQKMYAMRFVEDDMEYDEAYLESAGLIDWE